MNIGTLFSGIGSPEQALLRINPNFKTIFACEWDKYARQSYLANYDIDEAHFHKDINDMDGTQYAGKVDIIIGGSPCQDFSIAGLRAGIDGQKGILIYQYIRIIKEVMPPIFIYENVKGMLSDKGGRTLKEFIEAFREMGYHCHYDVLNTKDYGVPQNRERVFIVGFKDVNQYHSFQFAPKIKLVKRLKDILQSQVEEKYYLSDAILNGFNKHKERHIEKGTGFIFNPKDNNDIANCLRANASLCPTDNTIKVKSATSKGYEEATQYDSINLSNPNSETRRGRVGKQVAQTLDCACNQAVVEPMIFDHQGRKRKWDNPELLEHCPTLRAQTHGNEPCVVEPYRIRKLTPRECLRLQDFPDTFKQVVSDSQLYKQAGNSITVAVMEMILRQIINGKNTHSLF